MVISLVKETQRSEILHVNDTATKAPVPIERIKWALGAFRTQKQMAEALGITPSVLTRRLQSAKLIEKKQRKPPVRIDRDTYEEGYLEIKEKNGTRNDLAERLGISNASVSKLADEYGFERFWTNLIDKGKLEREAEAGGTYAEIAARTGVHESTVSLHMLANGVRRHRKATSVNKLDVCMEYADGKSMREIAKLLDTSQSTISRTIKSLGGPSIRRKIKYYRANFGIGREDFERHPELLVHSLQSTIIPRIEYFTHMGASTQDVREHAHRIVSFKKDKDYIDFIRTFDFEDIKQKMYNNPDTHLNFYYLNFKEKMRQGLVFADLVR